MTAFALDTDILIYAEGVERAPSNRVKIVGCQSVVENLIRARARIVLPPRVLAELHNVLRVRHRLTAFACSIAVKRLNDVAEVEPTSETTPQNALDLAATAGLRIFHAIILAAAGQAGCDLLVSEEFQDGFGWRGVGLTNPFGPSLEPRLFLG